jgi:hypothetical protein
MCKFLKHRALLFTFLTGAWLSQTITCVPVGGYDAYFYYDPYACCYYDDDWADDWEDFWDDFWDD